MANQCVIPPTLYRAKPYPNGLSLHHVMTVVAAVCTLLTIALCLFLLEQHLVHFMCPDQQKHLARIVILPALVALFSLFGIIFYDASKYLEPFPKLFEAIAICSLFELYVAYVSRGVPNNAAVRFRHAARSGRYAAKRFGPLLLRINFLFLYQYPLVVFACLIATEITSATQCELSMAYRTSQKIIRVISAISVIVAVAQIITFHILMRHELRGKKALGKLIGVKLLAFFVTALTVIFGFVKPGMAHRWPHASYVDIIVGIPNLVLCIIMVLFAFGWLILFGSSAVQHSSGTGALSALPALVQVMNISDIYLNTLAALTTKVEKEVDPNLSSDTSSDHVKTANGRV